MEKSIKSYAAKEHHHPVKRYCRTLDLRDDDRPETVLNRLKVYHDQTQPLIEFYTKKNVLKTVDGTKDMKEVFADIVAILG